MRVASIPFGPGTSKRLLAGVLVACGACVALFTTLPASAQSDRCLASECFSDQQIREFQIVDEDTLIVFAGRDRCPFKVTVDGLFCSLTYLPEVEFFRTRDRQLEILRGNRSSRDTGILDPSQDGFGRNDRVCTHNATLYALESFGLAALDPDTMPRGRPACEIREIASITDNDLVEILADEQIAPPPPPVGNGDISRREEQSESQDEAQ